MLMDKENDKKPQKKKRAAKSKDDTKMQDKLVEAALQSHLIEYAQKKSEKKRSLEDMSNLVSEQFSSFLVLGYNYDGDPISVMVANTQQEADSICALVNKFIIQNSSGPTL